MATSNDISIGQDKWIYWIDVDANSDETFSIDILLEPTWEFWHFLEIHCVAACCGIDAFGFWPGDISQAVSKVNKEKFIRSLITLRKEIINSNIPIISSSKLNTLFPKSVFIQLLDHIQKHI